MEFYYFIFFVLPVLCWLISNSTKHCQWKYTFIQEKLNPWSTLNPGLRLIYNPALVYLTRLSLHAVKEQILPFSKVAKYHITKKIPKSASKKDSDCHSESLIFEMDNTVKFWKLALGFSQLIFIQRGFCWFCWNNFFCVCGSGLLSEKNLHFEIFLIEMTT